MNKTVAAAGSPGEATAHHRPLAVTLQVASGCNLDCYMCSEHNRPVETRHARGLKSLSREVFDRVDAELLPYAKTLTIGMGGEPTIVPDFVEYVTRARARGVEVHLVTNGTQLRREPVARAIADNVAVLNVSIDSATRETYERIRLGSKWSSLREGLAAFNRHRLAHRPEERTHLTLSFVLMRSNVDELPAFVDLAAEFEADRVHAQHVIPVTEEGKAEPLIDEPERYAKARALAAERAAAHGINLDVPAPYQPNEDAAVPVPSDAVPSSSADAAPSSPTDVAPSSLADAKAPAPSHRRPIPCSSPTQEVFVSYVGKVHPCCHPYAHAKMTMGRLGERPFAEIWNSPAYRHLRAGLVSGDAHPICRGCSVVHDPPPTHEDPEFLEQLPPITELYAESEPPRDERRSATAAALSTAFRGARAAFGAR